MKKSKLVRNAFTVICLIYATFSYFLVEKFVGAIAEDQLKNIRTQLSSEVSAVRSSIESAIYSDIYIANSLATILTVDKELGVTRFNELSEALISNGQYIRNIGIATNYTITHVYPMEGNAKALGFDFRTVPVQFKSVEKARLSQSLILAGPLPLVQGGRAVIARYPIFNDFPENNDYWGGVSVVLKIDDLLADSGLTELSKKYHVGIRGTDGSGAEGRVFYGEPSIFNQPEVAYTIEIPNGSWYIAAKLELGSKASLYDEHHISLLRFFGYLMALLLLVSVVFLFRSYRLATAASYVDELTGIPNRRYAMEVLNNLLSGKGKRSYFSVISIDLNGFKMINDTYGHDAGDFVLKEVGELLSDTLRVSDFVCRFGGDEFLVILTRIKELRNSEMVVEKLKAVVAQADFRYKGNQLTISLSAGFAGYPKDAENIDELLSIADSAMYQDKQSTK